MFKRLLPAIVLFLVPACDDGTDSAGRDGDASVGGKADTVDADGDALSCPAEVFVTHAANDVNNHVFSNCHNASTGRFAAKACCEEEMALIEDISGCPSQVRFTNTSDASDKRCANDVADHDGFGEFVPTACCAPLCDTSAQFDDAGTCRNGDGTFEEEICCHRNFKLTQANCGGADWVAIDGGTRDFACRAGNGQFTFDACCVDACAEEISRTASVPESCNLDAVLSDECPSGSTPNSGGICHNPVDGQFVKAVCCELAGETDDLDIEASDACYSGIAQQACSAA
ncbi:MAG: hypothetical protein JKY37_13480 [Nannocystaceae bacterium]|nr:hypothetical protein [Nannocystaceae bacterium]